MSPPEDPPTIRPATAADLPALVALDAAAWDRRSTPAPLPLSGAWIHDIDPADLIVAATAAGPVGYVLLGARTPLPSSAHLGQLRGLAVHPDARRTGAGRALVRAAIDAARARGWVRLELQALATNEAAVALYRSEGFRVIAAFPDHFRLDGESVEDLVLALPLVATDAPPEWLAGGCHCGAVRFRALVRTWEALDCNCSMCTKKALLHLIVAEADFELVAGAEHLATYTFGTRVAKHHFCRSCGIHPFYRPRSHPDAYDVNVRCFDGDAAARFRVLPFDGRNWEQRVHAIR